ncbi:abortive infection family protein [Listeria booriae]|uniref:hypothetical protein n=1 Tax=Listeria booriae TaxID=1552123 RepID=UPI0016277D08|nr:hypothetical protein [Listeria booriae]MBC1650722.1 abortive infection family protein [Listeria booriae]
MNYNPRLRCIDGFQIKEVTHHFEKGHDELKTDSNQSIQEAKAMIESTLQYIKNKIDELTREFTNSNFNTQYKNVLCLLYDDDPSKMEFIKLSTSQFINTLSELRNKTGRGHGAIDPIKVSDYEALFYLRTAEDLCILLLDRMYIKLSPFKRNSVHSLFIHEGEKSYLDDTQFRNEARGITYILVEGIINQIEIERAKIHLDEFVDKALINELLREHMQDDAIFLHSVGRGEFLYYSASVQKYYVVHYVYDESGLIARLIIRREKDSE